MRMIKYLALWTIDTVLQNEVKLSFLNFSTASLEFKQNSQTNRSIPNFKLKIIHINSNFPIY